MGQRVRVGAAGAGGGLVIRFRVGAVVWGCEQGSGLRVGALSEGRGLGSGKRGGFWVLGWMGVFGFGKEGGFESGARFRRRGAISKLGCDQKVRVEVRV